MNQEEMFEHVEDLLSSGQTLKQNIVNDHHEKRDLLPVLWYVNNDGEATALAMVSQCRGHEHTPSEILSGQLVAAYREYGKPRLLVLASEGYCLFAEHDGSSTEVDLQSRGWMEADFANNAESQVQEAVIVTACQDDMVGGCDMVQVVAPYTYDDGLRVVWAERHRYQDDESGEIEGEVALLLRLAFTTSEEEWEEILLEGGGWKEDG